MLDITHMFCKCLCIFFFLRESFIPNQSISGRVYALNMWNREFKTNTLDKDAARRFRDTVFCVGGKQPEEKTSKDYLGHEPSTGPYFQWLNI